MDFSLVIFGIHFTTLITKGGTFLVLTINDIIKHICIAIMKCYAEQQFEIKIKREKYMRNNFIRIK